MALPIYHSQYTAAQIEASIGKTPRIKASTRTWEIWDIATSAYIDTGVSIDTELFVDSTLTEAGYAADAKTVGDKTVLRRTALTSGDNANNIILPGIYHKPADQTVANWPSDLAGSSSFLIVLPGVGSTGAGVQIVGSQSAIFWRYNSSSSHWSWNRFSSFSDMEGGKILQRRAELTAVDDANDIFDAGIYYKNASVTVAHWPADIADATSFLLQFPGTSAGVSLQIVGNSTALYRRYNSSITHGSWKQIADYDFADAAFRTRSPLTNADDANDIITAGIYRKDASVTVGHWPDELSASSSTLLQFPGLASTGAGLQIAGTQSAVYWRYNSSSSHWKWKRFAEGVKEYRITTDDNLIALFLSLQADSSPKTIYIEPGEHDIFAEYLAANVPIPPAGTDSSYYLNFNAFVPVNTKVVGLGRVILRWDPTTAQLNELVEGEGDNRGKVVCDIWSPINILGNVELENLTIICNNGRYCVHDDVHNGRDYRGMYHIFRNIRLIRETNDVNTTYFLQNTGTAWTDRCTFLYENCVFENHIGGTPFSSHDATQDSYRPDDVEYEGANVTFNHCVFLAGESSSYSLTLARGKNPDRIPIPVTVNSCYLNKRLFLQDRSAGVDSWQPYDVTLLHSGEPTIQTDTFDVDAFQPKIYP